MSSTFLVPNKIKHNRKFVRKNKFHNNGQLFNKQTNLLKPQLLNSFLEEKMKKVLYFAQRHCYVAVPRARAQLGDRSATIDMG